MFRTRFRQPIVAEFLPPSRACKTKKVVILCDGMPSIPRKQPLAQFLAKKGFWIIYPRYRGAGESGGHFLEKSPHEDIFDIVGDLPKEIEEIAFGRLISRASQEMDPEKLLNRVSELDDVLEEQQRNFSNRKSHENRSREWHSN